MDESGYLWMERAENENQMVAPLLVHPKVFFTRERALGLYTSWKPKRGPFHITSPLDISYCHLVKVKSPINYNITMFLTNIWPMTIVEIEIIKAFEVCYN